MKRIIFFMIMMFLLAVPFSSAVEGPIALGGKVKFIEKDCSGVRAISCLLGRQEVVGGVSVERTQTGLVFRNAGLQEVIPAGEPGRCKVNDMSFRACIPDGTTMYSDNSPFQTATSCVGWMETVGCDYTKCYYYNNGVCDGSLSDAVECNGDFDCDSGEYCNQGTCEASECGDYTYKCSTGQIYKCDDNEWSWLTDCDYYAGKARECDGTTSNTDPKSLCAVDYTQAQFSDDDATASDLQCSDAGDCSSNEMCFENWCVLDPTSEENTELNLGCAKDSDCLADEICDGVSGYCVANPVIQYSTSEDLTGQTDIVGPSEGMECAGDYAPANLICEDGIYKTASGLDGDDCSEDRSLDCPNGGSVVILSCTDGAYSKTGNVCSADGGADIKGPTDEDDDWDSRVCRESEESCEADGLAFDKDGCFCEEPSIGLWFRNNLVWLLSGVGLVLIAGLLVAIYYTGGKKKR